MNNATRLQYLQAMGINVAMFGNNQPTDGVNGTHKEPHLSRLQSIKKTEKPTEANIKPWQVLENQVATCTSCTLSDSRTQTVFGAGDINTDWMFIGEAPGKNEDLSGQPFVGRAGQLLTEMIEAIALKREGVYIANVIKCRPPDNRNPQAEEIDSCTPFLQQQIALIKPKIILAVGRIAAQALLKTNEPLTKLRGVVHQLNNIPLVVIYHPAYLLRALSEKQKAWQDLLLAHRTYQKIK